MPFMTVVPTTPTEGGGKGIMVAEGTARNVEPDITVMLP